jgi:hypothetical protein
MTLITYPLGGDHLAPGKDHFKGDHLTSPKPLKANIYADIGGHFTPLFNCDHGGHLFTPPFIGGDQWHPTPDHLLKQRKAR